MKKDTQVDGMSRRGFLKTTIAGAAAMGLPAVFASRRAEAAYQAGQRIHPNISPLRVIGIHDPNMTTDVQVNNSWRDQERLVRPQVIGTNLDRLASALAGEKDAGAAWRAIFVKPPGKAWSDVVVAIKTNHIAEQHTRSPVMAKVCHVLTDLMGVKGHNIHIYDACHGVNIAQSTPFKGLPEGVKIENQWGGSVTPAPVPAPWKGGNETSGCLASLARGEVDILVNIALCKGHGPEFGMFTGSLKNHFGTFLPGPGHAAGATDYLLSINKSPAILGQMDGSGKVLFPRQQLCLIDALWGSKGGPGGNPSDQLNRLFMGTFGPALDYQVATKFRRDTMGWPISERVMDRFLSEFGFSAEDLPAGGRIIDAMKYTA